MATRYDFIFSSEQDASVNRNASTFTVITYAALLVLVAVMAFVVGVMFERRTSTANSRELATFWQVWDILDKEFYGDLPNVQERKYGAIQGLVASLNDPFTTFAPPEQAAINRQQIDGHFGGVGIVVRETDDGKVIVQSIIPGNPADKAGIEAGDVFVEIDGQPVPPGFTTEQVASLVRGEVGTTVKLKMYRPETDETYEVTLKRAIIETPTVFSEDYDGVGYIQLTSFNGVATSQMETNLRAMFDENVRAIVLDLRANGGGLLDQAVSIADLFLDEGIVLTERGVNGKEQVFRSDSGDLAEDIPLVVLVDGGTASASEVLAGALQDRGRAILVGQRTFGKGVVQLVYNLTDGSQLRVTSSAWFTPDDRAINEEGLVPDLPVVQTFDNLGTDLVLQAALDYVNENYPPEEGSE